MSRPITCRMTKLLPRAILVVAWLILLTRTAAAYIDPGSGSFLIQVVIAALISAGVAVKMFWRNIKRAIFRRRTEVPDPDSDDN